MHPRAQDRSPSLGWHRSCRSGPSGGEPDPFCFVHGLEQYLEHSECFTGGMNGHPSDMTHCLVSSEAPASCASETLTSMRPAGELQAQSKSTWQLCLTLPQLPVTACPVSSSLSLLSPLCPGLPCAQPCKGQEARQHASVPNHT